jgi:hypothetical protein
MQSAGHDKPHGTGTSYPPLQRTQGRGTHSSGTGSKNPKGWATRPVLVVSCRSERWLRLLPASATQWVPRPSRTLRRAGTTKACSCHATPPEMSTQSISQTPQSRAGLPGFLYVELNRSILVRLADSECQIGFSQREITHPYFFMPPLYITSARFSSSCCRTGRAHPAISTRPAASSAALGDTP